MGVYYDTFLFLGCILGLFNYKAGCEESKKIQVKLKIMTFYNENHEVDLNGCITKRDYSTYEAIECSLCHKPIKGLPSFNKHGKPHLIYGMGAGFKAPLKPFADLGNIDYCEDCHILLAGSEIRLKNKFRK